MMKKILFSVLAVALLWSCGKDDGPDTPTPSEDENSVPVIAAQDFSAAETISDTEVIGTVKASDEDGDTLTFTIEANSDDLFEITASGELSLASGKTLDAAAKEQHNITVKVDDGEDTASATITIKVTAEDVTPTNEAPEMEDQEFAAAEDIADTDVIGQLEAADADEDDLTFAMVANDNDLFMLSDAGELTLAQGKALDYETATSHSITVSVTDGEATVEATVTITVEDVMESMADDPASFVTKWETPEDNFDIYIGANADYDYDFTIDWGDGTVETINTVPDDERFAHKYAEKGIYTVAIQGDFPATNWTPVLVNNNNFQAYFLVLISLEQWGAIEWQDLTGAFGLCEKMVYNATDSPDLTNVTSLEGMFKGAHEFDHDLGNWDIKNITNMTDMLDNSGMSKENMNATMIGWSNYVEQNNGPTGITLGLDGMTICGTDAIAAANSLEIGNDWILSGTVTVELECN